MNFMVPSCCVFTCINHLGYMTLAVAGSLGKQLRTVWCWDSVFLQGLSLKLQLDISTTTQSSGQSQRNSFLKGLQRRPRRSDIPLHIYPLERDPVAVLVGRWVCWRQKWLCWGFCRCFGLRPAQKLRFLCSWNRKPHLDQKMESTLS